MSSSQSQTPPMAGDGAANAVKRAPPTSIFMKKKPRFARGAPPQASKTTQGSQHESAPQQPNKPSSQTQMNAATLPALQAQSNGVTAAQQPSTGAYHDYPIVISKADLGNGMKFHGIKFTNKADKDGNFGTVNPYDKTQFARPVRLHRRYARDKQLPEEQNGEDDKERELHNLRRAERQAEREANQAQIAPGARKSQIKRKKNQKNVEDVYYDEGNVKQQKAAQLRYEETKPWHLEDKEKKNIWIGAYQEPLSESSVLFQAMPDGVFSMVPVERWYTFRQTDKVSLMSTDEVEKHMEKGYKPGRWFRDTAPKEAAKPVKRKKSSEVSRNTDGGEYRQDLDEMDYEAKDEFQDDDEGVIFHEDDDEAREIEQKIAEEFRQANLPATNLKTEHDWDAEEEKRRNKEKEERKATRKQRKRLVKHERKYEYDNDDESSNPYSDDSETDSDEERRLEEERNATAQKSGNSTQGTNTPAGRIEKHLKRPGSPNLSDASGNESRKKAKLSGPGMLTEGARSPLARSATGYGSGSETDSTRIRRQRSPHQSSQPGSRAQSPNRSGTPMPPPLPMPSLEEIRAAIPSSQKDAQSGGQTGISIQELGLIFKRRVSKGNTAAFIAMIKANTVRDPATGLLTLKE